MKMKPIFMASFFVCLLFFISFGFFIESTEAVTPVYCNWDDHSGNPYCAYTVIWKSTGASQYNVLGDKNVYTQEQQDAVGTVGVAAELTSLTTIDINYAAGAMDLAGDFCSIGWFNCNVYYMSLYCNGVNQGITSDPCFGYCSRHSGSETCAVSSTGTYEVKAYASVNTKDFNGNTISRTYMKSIINLDIGCTKNSDCGSNQECVIADNKVRTYCKDLPCTNECISGDSRCNGNTVENCYDSDSDGCTEWTGVSSCAYGCIDNLYGDAYCFSCSTICDGVCSSSACFGTDPDCDLNGNVIPNACCDYSPTCSYTNFIECSLDEKTYNIYEVSTACDGGCEYTYSLSGNCGIGKYCFGDNYDGSFPCSACSTICDGVCSSSACFGTDPDCSLTGGLQSCCGNNECDVGETYSSCSTDCPSCHGIIYTTVNDQYANPLTGYKIYSDSGYDGTTDSYGKKRSDVYLNSCDVYTDVTVNYPDGILCGTKSTYINWDNDDDYLTFICAVEKPNLYVDLYLDKSAYYLFDSLILTANIKDINGNFVNAQTAIYDPYLFTTTLPTYTSQYIYNGQIKSTGCYDFIVSATNSNYNSVNQKITICSTDYSGKISVFVKKANTLMTPLPNTPIYDSTKYIGTTNSFGKLDFSANSGSHSIKAYCPETMDLCATKTTEINYNGQISNIDIDCLCTKDSDDDGYTDDDEILMGTDPYDVTNNFDSYNTDILYNVVDAKPVGCVLALPLVIFIPTEEQNVLIKEKIISIDTQYLSSSYNENSYNTLQSKLINILDIDDIQIRDETITFKDVFEKTDNFESVDTDKGIFFIFTNTTTGKTSIFYIPSYCKGKLIGTAYGLGYGLRDDAVFVYDVADAVLQGAVLVIEKSRDIGGVWEEIKDLWDSFSLPSVAGGVEGFYSFFDILGDSFHEWILSIFQTGKDTYGKDIIDREDFASYQIGFYRGYFTGYILEQTGVILTGVGGAFKQFKAGTRVTQVSVKVLRVLQKGTRIMTKYGYEIASAMKKSELGVKFLDTGTDMAQDGYALLVKTMQLPGEALAKTTERVDAFLKPTTLGAEAVAERVGRLKNVFGFSDDVIAKLSNSKIGKKALAEWTEAEVRGLGKMADDVGDINFIDNQLADGRFKVGGAYTPKRTAELYDGMTTKWSKEDIKNLIKTQDTAIDDVNSLFGRELTSEESKLYNSIASKDSLESLKNIESEDGLKRIVKDFGAKNKDKSIGGAGNVDILTNNVALDHTFKETFTTVDNLGFKISDKITQKFSTVSSEYISRKKTVVIDILESSATEIQIKESILKAANTLHENVFLWDEIYYVFIRNGNGGKLTKYVIKNGEIIG
ncbi:hypothetical protein GQ473_06290 [archaeon]|nr:hypothetical protein [archaeon]